MSATGDPLARLRDAAARRAEAGLRRALRPRTPDHDGLVDLASNDYLGLAGDPRLTAGAVAAAREWGTGSSGSRLVTGTTELHAELDRRLAAFGGAPAGLVFSSGFLANLGAVTALAGPGTLVVSDQVNHASIVDACRLSRARVAIAPHRDAAAVERALAEREEEHAVVVTDAVFSVDGDLAPLTGLHRAVRAHGALLVVDEAHALGVVGEHGRGAVHAAGLAAEPDVIRTLTLSKSLASQGGAVLGAPEVIDTLVDTARAFIFDTGLNPPAIGAALAALDVLETEPDLPARARDRARALANLAAGSGLETADPAAAVVPVFLGEPHAALRAAETCAAHGVRVGCFRPPSVPKGRACLRLTARATLSEPDLTRLAAALAEIAGSTARSLHA
ncbi:MULTISPECIES: 8-amino-7-oxononanoate synthase [Actinomadura]|uniref:8-amino-7-oxononanoate synthase n=1 Tax=Actinomadura litoris TaxID=2678616 RepID=A0A7K1LD07_9ACTN|nr:MULTISPECIES: 8-amino-7-oxononanoate synthase [Actinomadura]MBT2208428.1 8-amino-7-oxononanoate synthase [Actinomadura sp. NEAU-AAG7]MUN42307.1 aminotransferase class I/II-fold pyridoxal phosphate-dependent enzyme [Actinomadura litoris]